MDNNSKASEYFEETIRRNLHYMYEKNYSVYFAIKPINNLKMNMLRTSGGMLDIKKCASTSGYNLGVIFSVFPILLQKYNLDSAHDEVLLIHTRQQKKRRFRSLQHSNCQNATNV